MDTSARKSNGPKGITVRLEPPAEMNLIGYFLRGILQRAVDAAGPAGRLPLVGSRFLIRSEGMEVTLGFREDEVEIRRGRWPRIDATIEADLPTLVSILGGRGMVSPWLSGRLKARGAVWRFPPLLRLLKQGLAETDLSEVSG